MYDPAIDAPSPDSPQLMAAGPRERPLSQRLAEGRQIASTQGLDQIGSLALNRDLSLAVNRLDVQFLKGMT